VCVCDVCVCVTDISSIKEMSIYEVRVCVTDVCVCDKNVFGRCVCVREVRVCVTDTCCVCDRILNNKRDIYI